MVPRRKRGQHLEMALSGAFGSEMAKKVSEMIGKVDKSKTKPRILEDQLISDVVETPGSVKNDTRLKPSLSTLTIPLPAEYDEWTLVGLANSAAKDKATRLRVIASLYAGLSPSDAAEANGTDVGKVYLWLARFRAGGVEAL